MCRVFDCKELYNSKINFKIILSKAFAWQMPFLVDIVIFILSIARE